MSNLALLLAVIGPPAVAAGWLIVRSGRASLWIVNGILLPSLGAAALLTGEIEATRGYAAGRAVILGAAAGLALYLATRAFMGLAGTWPPLARHTQALYETRSGISLVAALAISVALVAPAEEILWRGLVLQSLDDAVDPLLLSALFSWIAYVAANAFSGSVPIVLGALVGGAAWTALASTGLGLAASIPCHMMWTGLMLAFPPLPKRA